MMLTRIDSPGLSTNRLDPAYYRPEHLRDSSLRSEWPRQQLEALTPVDAPIVYGVLKPDDRGDRHRVAKAERFDGMFVWTEDCDAISEEMFSEFGRAEAKEGDLLIAIGGYVGRPAIVRGGDGLRLVVNRHLARVRIDPSKCDPCWALAYFSSAHGERQLTREITGSVQAGINLCDLRLVEVPLPEDAAQRYIGDKVRQAERLRERARTIGRRGNEVVERWNQAPVPPDFTQRPRRISAKAASPFSLGPNFNWAMEGHTFIPDAAPLATLIDSCACGDPIRADQRSPGPYTYYGASGPIDSHNEFNFEGEFVVVAQDGTVGRACVARGRFWANNHVWVLKLKDGVDPDAVAGYLARHYRYWAGLTTGSVVPKVTSENLLLASIPKPVARAVDVGADFRAVTAAVSAADALCEAARQLVVGLLEGKTSEAELVAAQKALDSDDRSADRSILGMLRRSVGADPSALFPELPELYALLDLDDDSEERH